MAQFVSDFSSSSADDTLTTSSYELHEMKTDLNASANVVEGAVEDAKNVESVFVEPVDKAANVASTCNIIFKAASTVTSTASQGFSMLERAVSMVVTPAIALCCRDCYICPMNCVLFSIRSMPIGYYVWGFILANIMFYSVTIQAHPGDAMYDPTCGATPFPVIHKSYYASVSGHYCSTCWGTSVDNPVNKGCPCLGNGSIDPCQIQCSGCKCNRDFIRINFPGVYDYVRQSCVDSTVSWYGDGNSGGGLVELDNSAPGPTKEQIKEIKEEQLAKLQTSTSVVESIYKDALQANNVGKARAMFQGK